MAIKIEVETRGEAKPKDNYLTNSKPRGEELIEEIQKQTINKGKIPVNSPITVIQDFFVESVFFENSGVTHIPLMFEQALNTKYYLPGTGVSQNTIILAPIRYRMALVRDIIMAFDVSLINVGSGFPPVADSSYSINFYLSVSLLDIVDGLEVFGAAEPLFSYPVQFNYDKNTDTWSVTNPNVDFYLADFISERLSVDVSGTLVPDFSNTVMNNSNTQITQNQFNDLRNTNNTLAGFLGVADDELAALSAGNNTHFEFYFNTSAVSGTVFLAPRVNCRLIYSGVAANFNPLTS